MAAQRKTPGHFAKTETQQTSVEPTIRRRPAHAAPVDTFAYEEEPYVAQPVEAPRVKRKKRSGCLIFLIIMCVLVAILSVGGFFGYKLYQSAMTVQAEAKDVMAQVNNAKSAIKDGDAAALEEVASTVSDSAHNIYDEVNTPIWSFATIVPVVGSDIRSVRTLADILVDLSDNALTPVASNSSIMNLSNVFSEGKINVEALQGMAGALDEAAPAISRSAEKVEKLPEAHVDKVNEVLTKVKDALVEADDMVKAAQEILPYLPQMLGANGQTRSYLIVAQNNAEARSTGGLPGSMGILSITDGRFDLGDFTSILHEDGLYVEAEGDEKSFWSTNFDTDPAQVNFLADFSRVGKLCRDYWQQSQGQTVDGVFALDPVFLQHMVGLTGRVEIEDGYGSWIDGTDTARTLLNTVYVSWYPDNTDAQDLFFSQTAESAAKSFFANIDKAHMTDLLKTFFDDVNKHRFYAWMVNEDEEALMVKFGADGKVGNDPTKPEVGIYINDSTYSKISWYIGLDVSVGDGNKNFDGTTTYPVRVEMRNTINENEVWSLPRLVVGLNDAKWSQGDMINRFFVLGPAGGSISDIVCETGEEITLGTCYGVDGFKTLMHTDWGESDIFTFNVTVSSEATEPLKVRTTPLGQEELINITYAWE